MAKTNLISVIIPAYNVEKTIKRCLESVFEQKNVDYEVIVVDDGSTDKTSEILKNTSMANCRVLRTKNNGAASARNVGIDNAKGDYICFVDADDIVSPHYLEQMLMLLLDNEADIVCTRYERNKEKDFERLTDKVAVVSGDTAVRNLLQMSIDNGPVAKLFSKKVIGRIRMPDVMVAEDLYFNYLVMKGANRVVLNDSVLYSYVRSSGSLSTKHFSPKRMQSLDIVMKIDDDEKSFYSRARVFMEAYFILEQIVLAKAEKEFPDEYARVKNILLDNRKKILSNKQSSKRQKLVARLLGFGPKIAVAIMTSKSRLRG